MGLGIVKGQRALALRGGRLPLALIVLLAASLWFGCREDERQPLTLGINRDYRVTRLELLRIHAGRVGGTYQWVLLGHGDGEEWKYYQDSVVGDRVEFLRAHPSTGIYQYECRYTEGDAVIKVPFRVHVDKEFTVYSPYAVDVLEYQPGPGPRVNSLLRVHPGNSRDEVLFRCKGAVCGPREGGLSLGAFGGYIVMAFDHLVLNCQGEMDFAIYSNVQLLREEEGRVLANSNPGIVEVAYDRNGNGRPDADEWYEIRGAHHESSQADYQVTYYRPTVTAPQAQIDSLSEARLFNHTEYIRWTDNRGGEGYIPHLVAQDFDTYWPAGEHNDVETLTLRGRLLPWNAKESVRVTPNPDGTFKTSIDVIRWSLGRGYAGDTPSSIETGIDIADAIDREGNPVSLPGIEYVRIYTAASPRMLARIGVQATEIEGAEDLHMRHHTHEQARIPSGK